MNSKLVKNLLDGVLCASMVFSIFFFARFYFESKQLRAEQPKLQNEATAFQNSRNLLNLLIRDTMEYNKAHPDPNLTHILDSLRQPAAPASGSKPAGK